MSRPATLTDRVKNLEAMVSHYTAMVSHDTQRLSNRLDKLERTTPEAGPWKIIITRYDGHARWIARLEDPRGHYFGSEFGATRRSVERKAKRLIEKRTAPPTPSEKYIIEVRT